MYVISIFTRHHERMKGKLHSEGSPLYLSEIFVRATPKGGERTPSPAPPPGSTSPESGSSKVSPLSSASSYSTAPVAPSSLLALLGKFPTTTPLFLLLCT